MSYFSTENQKAPAPVYIHEPHLQGGHQMSVQPGVQLQRDTLLPPLSESLMGFPNIQTSAHLLGQQLQGGNQLSTMPGAFLGQQQIYSEANMWGQQLQMQGNTLLPMPGAVIRQQPYQDAAYLHTTQLQGGHCGPQLLGDHQYSTPPSTAQYSVPPSTQYPVQPIT